MPGRAKPEEEKQQIFVKTRNKWMDKTVEVYNEEQSKLSGEKRLGLRGVCNLMEERCWKEDKTKISLDKSATPQNRKRGKYGGQSPSKGRWKKEFPDPKSLK